MDRWSRVGAERLRNEVVHARQEKIRLYDRDTRTDNYGLLEVTSHRILLHQDGDILAISLALVNSVEKEDGGFFHSDKIILHLAPPPTSSTVSYVKVGGKGGITDIATAINHALSQEKWRAIELKLPAKKEIRSGIAGIEKKIQQKTQADTSNISKAFQDLDRLMEMAKPMVSLANSISTKIRERQGEITEDETVQFKSYLLSLGIDDPITKDTAGSDKKYYQGLAKEMFLILDQPIQEAGGMMTLTDAYVRVNRARGLELVSPDDLLMAAKALKETNLPMSLHKFPTGVMVLRTWNQSEEELMEKTVYLVEAFTSITAEALALELKISVLLARERLGAAVEEGKVVLDRSISGLLYYPNKFLTQPVM